MRVLNFTGMYTRGLMPRMFFAFTRVCHTRGLFKLWEIYTVYPADNSCGTICTVGTHTYVHAHNYGTHYSPSLLLHYSTIYLCLVQ